ncbi:MAG: mannose-1-phosphate guanylyltransferase [Nitrosomonadaceae bacterium]|nr:mannose-1-phosphate guanylyltransferase [Nitrosomonadaceae bacterium]
MILAAGRGIRMRHMTDNVPKPLLCVGDKTLIEYHIENLARAGFLEIVINHAYLGKMIEEALGNGSRYGVKIYYSPEVIALETAGGIVRALPLLDRKNGNQCKEQPFLVVNADIYCEYNFTKLLPMLRQMRMCKDTAHLVMVNNQAHHPDGDFFLDSGRLLLTGSKRLTFSGISVYKPSFFNSIGPGVVTKLAPKLYQAITEGNVSGEYYDGVWVDVGTPERLYRLDAKLRSK